MTDLADLLKRVTEASGSDKALARAIQCEVGGWYRRTPSEGRTKHPTFIHPDDVRDGKPVYDSLHGTDVWPDVPDVTASLDAALVLVHRLGFSGIINTWRPFANVARDGSFSPGNMAEHVTPALALLAALLKALTQPTDPRGDVTTGKEG